MSALGQKQTFAAHQPMSALPPKADMCGANGDVCFGPIADITFRQTGQTTQVIIILTYFNAVFR
jgi:hypothetical protein